MDAATREIVRRRAGDRCEYCQVPQQATPFIPFHVEHMIAKQHVDIGHNDLSGLAYACDRCSAYKGGVAGAPFDLFNNPPGLVQATGNGTHVRVDTTFGSRVYVAPGVVGANLVAPSEARKRQVPTGVGVRRSSLLPPSR